METGLSELKELFELKDRDLRTYSPLTLAYIGDATPDQNWLMLHSVWVPLLKK